MDDVDEAFRNAVMNEMFTDGNVLHFAVCVGVTSTGNCSLVVTAHGGG